MGRVVTEPDGKVADWAVARLFSQADIESQVDFVDSLIENSEEDQTPAEREDLTAAFGALYRENRENTGLLASTMGKLVPAEREEVDITQSDEAIAHDVIDGMGVDDDVAERFREGLEGERAPIGPANDFFAQAMNEVGRELESSRIGSVMASLSDLSRFADEGPERAVADARDLAEIVDAELEADDERWLFSPQAVESPAADGVDDEPEAEDESRGDEPTARERNEERAEGLDARTGQGDENEEISW